MYSIEGPEGLRLTLKKGPDELTQRDVEMLMNTIARDTRGTSVPEHHGKVVRAAIKLDWVEEPSMDVKDIDKEKPWIIRWLAEQIDLIYRQATAIPKASSSPQQLTQTTTEPPAPQS